MSGLKRGHVTIWGSCRNVLWCRVCCRSTFTFQASIRCMRVEECLHVWKPASCTWLEAMHSPQRRHYKCECPLTSERQRIHQALPRNLKYCLCNCCKCQQEEIFLQSCTPQTHWKGEVGPAVDVPLGPDTRQHPFLWWRSEAHWRLGRAPGWIMCEPHCSSSQAGLCEPAFVTNLCHSACFPMFYMQTANVSSYDLLALVVDD